MGEEGGEKEEGGRTGGASVRTKRAFINTVLFSHLKHGSSENLDPILAQ